MERELFREGVFARDNNLCVFCGSPGLNAHHLLERRLWADGGYHLDNGITVCEKCHILCEQTFYSVEEGRAAAGITNIILPDQLYDSNIYDKWGNIILPDERRSPGELFSDPSVQKILSSAGLLSLFMPYMKYPRTYHLPWSYPTRDDRTLLNLSGFEGRNVVITEKLDGENTSMYQDKIHARAIDGNSHPTQGWVKQFWSERAHDIPYGYRICGENLYARHSIKYSGLESYFYGFSVWDWDRCLSWDETLEWFALLDIESPEIYYEGPWNEELTRAWHKEWSWKWDGTEKYSRFEGYVVRVRDEYLYKEHKTKTAKFVRQDHLHTPERWDRNNLEINRLWKDVLEHHEDTENWWKPMPKEYYFENAKVRDKRVNKKEIKQ